MQSKVITGDAVESTRALERARKRVVSALYMAENGFLDYETMDDICRGLSLALKDMDDVNLVAVSERRAA
ncbi:MAG: hypothetical protein QOG00_1217 [Pyrinomonadaceae bacterium]|nr:hypothetical protein [Pyrinomonadaceae bacterium]